MSEIDYTPRQVAALGAGPGICRALNPERTFMCELDEGHDGDHHGFELPTVTLDEWQQAWLAAVDISRARLAIVTPRKHTAPTPYAHRATDLRPTDQIEEGER